MSAELIYVGFYSYILGTIPFGLILTKIFLKKDIRKIGSGNIGATNVLRTGSKPLGAATLIFDCLKGYASITLTIIFFSNHTSDSYIIFFSALLCLLGHIFPIWLKFKGGKGIAVYLGILFAISINLGLIFITSWIIILYLTKYSSLSSLISVLIIFLYSSFLYNFNIIFYFFIILIIVIYTHKENISRIIDNTENKTKF